MEAETPLVCATSTEVAEEELDSTIHGFNTTNVTVIEKHAPGDGSDSGVEDSFDLLARKNSSSMIQDLKDSGSETSSTSSRPSTSSKKKVSVQTPSKTQNSISKKPPPKKPVTARPSTLKTTLPVTPKPKSQDKPFDKSRPNPYRSTSSTRTPRTPVITPTDDGRWPSNSKNTMSRSFRGCLTTSDTTTVKNKVENNKNVLDKYGTLPRRRKEKSVDIKENVREPSLNRTASLRRQISRESTPARSLPPYPKKKTRIFAETSAQTSLTFMDINKLVDSGTLLERGERVDKNIQTEQKDETTGVLKQQLKTLQLELAAEKTEKIALKAELERNMQRVQAILDNTHCHEPTQKDEGDDSILELETRFQTVGQIVVKQENEISELHNLCRTLQRELDSSLIARQHLESVQQELESESRELQEFLAAEKWALCEALAEAEARGAAVAAERARLRHDALTLEARSRDLLLAQGAAVSGAAVALSGLAHRLDTLTGRLATAYNISDQQLDDDIYHNEAYNPHTPESPQTNGTTSFLNAVISAIKNTVTENLENEETLLDSETEPCLMMENVLEDVVHIDTHTHNLVSEPGASASSLVDQVIEADNLLTRLLKVLRVIQKMQDGDAAALKADLQQHRVHVERLSHDVCALSTACSTQRDDEVESMAQRLQEANSAVDNALETLQECGEEISKSPSLSGLQKKLETASVFCRPPASPGLAADQNANASVINTSV